MTYFSNIIMIKSFPIIKVPKQEVGLYYLRSSKPWTVPRWKIVLKNAMRKLSCCCIHCRLITMGRYHATPHPTVKIKIGKENAKEIWQVITMLPHQLEREKLSKVNGLYWYETAIAHPTVKMKIGKENAKSAQREMTTTHCCRKHNDQFQSWRKQVYNQARHLGGPDPEARNDIAS